MRISDATPVSNRGLAAAEKSPAKVNEWVDGSRRERDRYEVDEEDEEDDGDRKLSKSDRKQLRKLKARNRAA